MTPISTLSGRSPSLRSDNALPAAAVALLDGLGKLDLVIDGTDLRSTMVEHRGTPRQPCPR